jgi:hypothetical protein
MMLLTALFSQSSENVAVCHSLHSEFMENIADCRFLVAGICFKTIPLAALLLRVRKIQKFSFFFFWQQKA